MATPERRVVGEAAAETLAGPSSERNSNRKNGKGRELRKKKKKNVSMDFGKIRASVNVYDLVIYNKYAHRFGCGAYHTGIEINGIEWAYGHAEDGTGIYPCLPGTHPNSQFREKVDLGNLDLTAKDVARILERLRPAFPGYKYHMLYKNCNHFTEVFYSELTKKRCPGYFNRLASFARGIVCFLPEEMQPRKGIDVVPPGCCGGNPTVRRFFRQCCGFEKKRGGEDSDGDIKLQYDDSEQAFLARSLNLNFNPMEDDFTQAVIHEPLSVEMLPSPPDTKLSSPTAGSSLDDFRRNRWEDLEEGGGGDVNLERIGSGVRLTNVRHPMGYNEVDDTFVEDEESLGEGQDEGEIEDEGEIGEIGEIDSDGRQSTEARKLFDTQA